MSEVTVLVCRQCDLRLTDELEPLENQRIDDCPQHPARAKGWRGSTPHDFEEVSGGNEHRHSSA